MSLNIFAKNVSTANIDVNTISSKSNDDGKSNKIIVEQESTKFTTDNIQIHSKKKFNKINSDGGLILSGGAVDADYGIGIDNAQVSIFQNLNVFTRTNFHNQPLTGVSSINKLTTVGGVYSGTSMGTLINTTDITSLKPEGVGIMRLSKTKKGDCFKFDISGDASMVAGDTVQIIIIHNGNVISESEIITVKNESTFFEINAKVTIRSIDEMGSIHTRAKFEYDNNTVRFNQTTTANTTRASTFDVLFKFVTRSNSSAIQTQQFTLKKIY